MPPTGGGPGFPSQRTLILSMTPVENERGERLVAVRSISERAAAAMGITFALVIARGRSGFLLVHDIVKNVWELPGGHVETGESARQCAERELLEESGQVAVGLRWRALLELEVPAGPGFRTRYGALYRADVPGASPFVATGEIDAIGFWMPSRLPSAVSAIDEALLSYHA